MIQYVRTDFINGKPEGCQTLRLCLSDSMEISGSQTIPLHYRLSSIKGVRFRFANFASHFIRVQIFQIYFPLILSES